MRKQSSSSTTEVQREDSGEGQHAFAGISSTIMTQQILDKANLQSDKQLLQNLPRFNREHIEQYKLLGSGSFSNVYQANVKGSDKWYAIKRLKKNAVPDSSALASSTTTITTFESDLLQEAALLSLIDHEHVITLHGVSEGNVISSIKNHDFYLVLDLLGETLDDRLLRWQKEQRNFFRFRRGMMHSDTIISRLEDIALGIARGMEYLHSLNILFR